MRGKKNMIFRNALGQEVVFDNRTLFLESIDMIGAPGIHAAESLAGADGQQTICHQLGPKTIPCGLALKAVGDVEWLKNRLSEVFFPGHGNAGTMTVVTQYGRYEIECYPANVPSFTMAENDGAYRFNVDFVADYPYWRKGCSEQLLHPVAVSVRNLPGYLPAGIIVGYTDDDRGKRCRRWADAEFPGA